MRISLTIVSGLSKDRTVSRAFWKRLVIPLSGLFAVAIGIHWLWDADGFFLNLATELVGILITIWYIDWVLRQHERHKWKPTDTRIAKRLRIPLNAVVSSIRRGLGYEPEILNERVLESGNFIGCHKEIIRVGEHVIAPGIHQRIRSLDAIGWKSLAQQIGHIRNETLMFLTAFQNRLSPEQISHLLDVEEGLSNSLTFYSTFPELMGVPVGQLPKTKSPPEELQQFSCQSAANELRKVLCRAKQLSETVAEIDD